MPGPDPRLNRKEGKRMGPKTFVVGKDGKREIIRGGKPPKETPEQPRLYGKPDLPRPRDKRRPESEPRNLLIGGQAKLDKNKNNKLDAQDFKILRAEKAKGRGQGLQDEKMKPGKVMKAKRGKLVPLKKDPTKAISSVKPSAGGKGSGTTNLGNPRKKGDPFLERRMKLAGAKSLIGKGGRIGAAAAMLGLAGAGAASLGQKIGRKLSEAKKKNKKMGGGMMKRYNTGGGADMGNKKYKPLSITKKSIDILKSSPRMGGMPRERTRGINKNPRRDFTLKKKMGGGMMMRPMGYKTGKMIMARGCKLGRKKATKIT